MKYIITLLIVITLSSCQKDEISLGQDFILYKGEERRFTRVGIDLGEGIQRIIVGDISGYCFTSQHVVVKFTNDTFYFFEKSKALNSQNPSKEVKGPFNSTEFKTVAKNLNLPPLVYIP